MMLAFYFCACYAFLAVQSRLSSIPHANPCPPPPAYLQGGEESSSPINRCFYLLSCQLEIRQRSLDCWDGVYLAPRLMLTFTFSPMLQQNFSQFKFFVESEFGVTNSAVERLQNCELIIFAFASVYYLRLPEIHCGEPVLKTVLKSLLHLLNMLNDFASSILKNAQRQTEMTV